jgi:hypothetical protein
MAGHPGQPGPFTICGDHTAGAILIRAGAHATDHGAGDAGAGAGLTPQTQAQPARNRLVLTLAAGRRQDAASEGEPKKTWPVGWLAGAGS